MTNLGILLILRLPIRVNNYFRKLFKLSSIMNLRGEFDEEVSRIVTNGL